MALVKSSRSKSASTRNLGFEAKLWLEEDKLKKNMDSGAALRGSAFLRSEAEPQVVIEARDNFRKDDDVRWQPRGGRSTTTGSQHGERGGVHQFGAPPKCSTNFAWVQHFIYQRNSKENQYVV